MFDLKPEDRIHFWRQFRVKLKEMETEEALQSVVDLWGKCPTTNGYLDYADCKDWPDPWTLLNDNHYCDVAVALGIFYTIYLSEILDNSTLSIVIYKDEHGFVNAVHITKYALNITYRQVLNTTSIPKDLSIFKVYTVDDLKAQKYL
jgi:hypothetical protein